MSKTISTLNLPKQHHRVMHDVIPKLNDGMQIWDSEGKLLYANRVSFQHFGNNDLEEVNSFKELLPICKTEAGRELPADQFPVALTLRDHQCHTDFCIQTIDQIGNNSLWIKINSYPFFDINDKFEGVITSTHDISTHIKRSLELAQHAQYDPLTQLPNRLMLDQLLKVALAHAHRIGNLCGVCMLDLDGFKQVNDNFGHEMGDLLLKAVAKRITACLRTGDTAIRIGGDEFIIILTDLKTEFDYKPVLDRFIKSISEVYLLKNIPISISASIGISLFPSDDQSAANLLHHADKAMYRAKEKGKNQYQIFNPAAESKINANHNLIRSIERALSQEQFELYYQPKVDCLHRKIIGFEALIRWNHPFLGVRSPGEFLPLIEKTDLIIEMGNWVISKALNQIQQWDALGFNFHVSVNVAARQFLQTNFSNILRDILKQFPKSIVNRLEIEILESAALQDVTIVNQIVHEFKELGIKFSLDDFGTGYSSLTHLKHIKVQTLKIDQSFIRDMLQNSEDLMLVKAILGLAEPFKMKTIAEGVESIEQVLLLMGLNCHTMQGYYFSPPMPVDEVVPWINEFHPDPLWLLSSSDFPKHTDFDLLLLEVKHNYYVEQMIELIAEDDLVLLEKNSHDCFFCDWIEPNKEKFHDDKIFNKMIELHKKLHKILNRIYLQKTDSHESKEKLIEQLELLKRTFSKKMYQFRRECLKLEDIVLKL